MNHDAKAKAGSPLCAILIAANKTRVDDLFLDSDYWYDLVVQYRLLQEAGFARDDIFVVYGDGSDFPSIHRDYSTSQLFNHKITTLSLTKQHVEDIFDLANQHLQKGGFLYVWWFGHGRQDPFSPSCKSELYIEEGNGLYIPSATLRGWVDKVDRAGCVTLAVGTCNSGQVGDAFASKQRTIVLTAAACDEQAFDEPANLSCNHLPASEFNYLQSEALRQMNICGQQVASDLNGDHEVSLQETGAYLTGKWSQSKPLIFDPSALADKTFLNRCPP
ncbi:MAG TPA: hypothetical protein VHQ90_10650 [Thermoanaerobaculia bacterium]|nr:hypothetical protein [Thermoanaerobaculia bacterium]